MSMHAESHPHSELETGDTWWSVASPATTPTEPMPKPLGHNHDDGPDNGQYHSQSGEQSGGHLSGHSGGVQVTQEHREVHTAFKSEPPDPPGESLGNSNPSGFPVPGQIVDTSRGYGYGYEQAVYYGDGGGDGEPLDMHYRFPPPQGFHYGYTSGYFPPLAASGGFMQSPLSADGESWGDDGDAGGASRGMLPPQPGTSSAGASKSPNSPSAVPPQIPALQGIQPLRKLRRPKSILLRQPVPADMPTLASPGTPPLGAGTGAGSRRNARMVTQRPKFTLAEDALILRLRNEDDLSWPEISSIIPSRSAKALQVHYSVSLREQEREEWTAEEDAELLSLVDEHDRAMWEIIGKRLGGPVGAACCAKRYRQLQIKQDADIRARIRQFPPRKKKRL